MVMDGLLLQRYLRETRLIRQPKRALSTFGATRIEYCLVSPIDDLPNKTRLREGLVVSERPKVLTPEVLRERFEGFGEESAAFARWLESRYRDVLRALEYRFKNHDLRTRVLGQDPRETASRVAGEMEAKGSASAAVIFCPDAAWSLALMKFTLEEAERSFPTHVRDLDTRGLFDRDGGRSRRSRAEVERLFEDAARDPAAREALGRLLRERGLFGEYEDRFLSLFR